MRLLGHFREFGLDKHRPAKRALVRLVRLPEPLVEARQMEDVITGKRANIVTFADGFQANSTGFVGSAPGGRGKGSGAEGFTYQESWLAIDESFSSSFDCQAFRDIGSDMFLKMGILSSFSTMRGRLFGGPLKRLYSLRSLLSDVHDQYVGFEEEGRLLPQATSY
jgi:hypothetical protein